MTLTNIDKFFMVLEKFIKSDRKNERNEIIGISIAIFRNEEETYNIYFGLDPEIKKANDITLNDEHNFLHCNHRHIIKENTGVCLENVSETELHYILFAFNMKYGVETGPFKDIPSIINFYSNGVLFPFISIHFRRNNVRSDLLLQHLEGTENNFFRYRDWQTNKTTEQKLIDNYRRSYNDYVQMLNYYLSNFYVKPILESYASSYEEFIDEIAEQTIENTMQQNQPTNKDKQFVFVPADRFIEETN